MAFGSPKDFEDFLDQTPNKQHPVTQFYKKYKVQSFKPVSLDNDDPLKKDIMKLIELREKFEI